MKSNSIKYIFNIYPEKLEFLIIGFQIFLIFLFFIPKQENDVVLYKLNTRVPFSAKIFPICLHKEEYPDEVRDINYLFAGFGSTAHGEYKIV